MVEQDWSVPETDVLRSIRRLLDGPQRGIVATMVDVEGSAYRRPGAKMVIEEDGQGFGHITAGCLEDEVFELAGDVLDAGNARIETYDLMEDDDDVWGLGIGCNGVIDILLEPLDESYRPAIDAFEAGDSIGVLTVYGGDVPIGARAYYRDGEITLESDEFPRWLADALETPAAQLVTDGKSDSITVETDAGTAEVFVDGINPAPDLVVCGSGHDVGPVVEIGKKNDFRVTVVGFRGAVDLDSRFPDADETITTSPANIQEALDFDESTYAVVMTHNYIDDRLALEELLQTPTPYIGLMGPRKRFDEMREDFEDEGRTFSDAELDRLYTPIGLDLGGGSPYGIATSIVAEVMAVHNDRDPGHLKAREGPIHERTEIGVSEAADD